MAFLLDFMPMTPEEKSLLERTHKLAEENNEILRKMRRSNRWSIALRIFYWIIILGLAFGAYYFVQPYATSLMEAMDQLGGFGNLQDLLKNPPR